MRIPAIYHRVWEYFADRVVFLKYVAQAIGIS
jgi:hypothetical protein